MNEDYSYFQSNEFRSSLEAYERMIGSGESVELDSETLVDIAEYYAMEQRMDDANRCIQYATSFYPDSIDPQIFLSRQQMFEGNEEEAWKICKSITDQDDREVTFLKAELFLNFERKEKALPLLLYKYKEISDRTEAADFLYDSISLLNDYGLGKEALEWVFILRRNHPNYEDTIVLEAEVRNLRGEYALAIELAEQYIEMHPYDTRAWMQLAEANGSLQHYDEAVDALDYALAIEPDNAEMLMLKGNLLHDSGYIADAHECYARFLEYFPNDEHARMLDAECLMDLGEVDAAIRPITT